MTQENATIQLSTIQPTTVRLLDVTRKPRISENNATRGFKILPARQHPELVSVTNRPGIRDHAIRLSNGNCHQMQQNISDVTSSAACPLKIVSWHACTNRNFVCMAKLIRIVASADNTIPAPVRKPTGDGEWHGHMCRIEHRTGIRPPCA